MRTAVFLCALSLVLTLVLLSACAPAQAAPALFDEYELGAPKSELLTRPGMKPGEGSMAGDLILPGVSWAGCEWTAQFGFEREKLTTVTLLGRYGRERFNAVRRHLSGEGFEILGIVVDEKSRHLPGRLFLLIPGVLKYKILNPQMPLQPVRHRQWL